MNASHYVADYRQYLAFLDRWLGLDSLDGEQWCDGWILAADLARRLSSVERLKNRTRIVYSRGDQ